jgi:hypothetical protein
MLSTVSVAPRLAVRVRPGNADHHLWLNNGTWFIHLWFHDGPQKRRLRASLGTKDLAIARSRRDSVLSELGRHVPTDVETILRRRASRTAIAVCDPLGSVTQEKSMS